MQQPQQQLQPKLEHLQPDCEKHQQRPSIGMCLPAFASPFPCMSPLREDQLWDPKLLDKINKSQFDDYIDLSCSACILGGGRNVGHALQELYESGGDFKLATHRLLRAFDSFPLAATVNNKHTINDSINQNSHFNNIESNNNNNNINQSNECNNNNIAESNNIKSNSKINNNNNNNKSNSSNNINNNNLTNNQLNGFRAEIFPCKVCGRIFEKIKSRSAHMKRHKNESENNNKLKYY